ncbi:hypothetical protein CDAR_281641 [Caerostris darwini]|uniref:Uncharacterized protein n=1 Tax=Caerostris darwini TaxID=1538125 RepID=A0AAV4UI12_9ARAC|nr:hypothetical protein CDAR_281641 [Caerostris darwini]
MRHCYSAFATLSGPVLWECLKGGGRVQTRYSRELWWTRSMLLIKSSLSTLRHGSPKGRRAENTLRGAVDKVKGRFSGARSSWESSPHGISKKGKATCKIMKKLK